MRALALVALVTLSGCLSFITTRNTPRGSPPHCAGYTAPVADSVLTGVLLGVVVASAIKFRCDSPLGYCDGYSGFNPTGWFVLPLLASGTSTVFGFDREAACRSKLGGGTLGR